MKKLIAFVLAISLTLAFAVTISAKTVTFDGYQLTTEIRSNRSYSYHFLKGSSWPAPDSAKMWYRIQFSDGLYSKNALNSGTSTASYWQSTCMAPNGYIVDHANTIFNGVTVEVN